MTTETETDEEREKRWTEHRRRVAALRDAPTLAPTLAPTPAAEDATPPAELAGTAPPAADDVRRIVEEGLAGAAAFAQESATAFGLVAAELAALRAEVASLRAELTAAHATMRDELRDHRTMVVESTAAAVMDALQKASDDVFRRIRAEAKGSE